MYRLSTWNQTFLIMYFFTHIVPQLHAKFKKKSLERFTRSIAWRIGQILKVFRWWPIPNVIFFKHLNELIPIWQKDYHYEIKRNTGFLPILKLKQIIEISFLGRNPTDRRLPVGFRTKTRDLSTTLKEKSNVEAKMPIGPWTMTEYSQNRARIKLKSKYTWLEL